jgi:hypothetical protein
MNGERGSLVIALSVYLDALFGAEPEGGLAELRWRLPSGGGMGQEFFPTRSHNEITRAIATRGRETDVYVGIAPRRERAGRRETVERVHALWADCDTDEALARLERFDPQASMVVCSGIGRHAYWALWPPASPDEAEQANRRLAHALEADMQATDAARILRPPGSFNFKHGPGQAVTFERLNVDI